jgi:hypothetical protein
MIREHYGSMHTLKIAGSLNKGIRELTVLQYDKLHSIINMVVTVIPTIILIVR